MEHHAPIFLSVHYGKTDPAYFIDIFYLGEGKIFTAQWRKKNLSEISLSTLSSLQVVVVAVAVVVANNRTLALCWTRELRTDGQCDVLPARRAHVAACLSFEVPAFVPFLLSLQKRYSVVRGRRHRLRGPAVPGNRFSLFALWELQPLLQQRRLGLATATQKIVHTRACAPLSPSRLSLEGLRTLGFAWAFKPEM